MSKTFSRHSNLRCSSFKFVALVRKRNFGCVRILTPENSLTTTPLNLHAFRSKKYLIQRINGLGTFEGKRRLKLVEQLKKNMFEENKQVLEVKGVT